MIPVSVTVKGMACGIHLPFEILIDLMTDNMYHIELIEGAFEGYLNSMGCAMCAAESIDSTIEIYVSIFVDKFLPLITSLDIKPKISLVNLKPLSYG
mgnify:CR=1 FL=1